MDAISYEYTKQRKQFGFHPHFADSNFIDDQILCEPTTPPTPTFDPNDPTQQFTPLTPMLDTETIPEPKPSVQWFESLSSTVELDCIPTQAIHEVNTERYLQHPKGTSHTDGAWPAEIKTNEFVDRQRYVRRLINEPAYQNAVVNLTKTAENVIAQNNTIDCYQQYFPNILDENYTNSINDSSSNNDSSIVSDFHVSPPSAKTVCVFRDPNPIKRVATKISFHPDSAHKLAVSYSITAFQSQSSELSLHSYIWDMTSPNHPDAKLIPPSSLTTLAYNPRSPDHIVGGAYNGMIAFFDLRKGATPVESSILEKSHHDPVYDIYWIQSRTGNECCSISTDGQLLWWDIRKLRKGFTDSMWLQNEISPNEPNPIKYGGCSMEYKSDAGATRFLVGTEQGVSILCDRKAKKDAESTKSIKSIYGLSSSPQSASGSHHGPVCSIQRSPFNVKYFLTCGDWSSKIWMEDLREPILVNRYDRAGAYVSSAQWSTTRPGVYYTAKNDGVVDVYDLYHRQESPVYSLKVSDQPLTSMKIHSNGKNIAIGDQNGSVTVLSVSKGLVELQKDEKINITNMLERETKREKALEVRKAQAKRDAGKSTNTSNNNNNGKDINNIDYDNNEIRESLTKAEEEFFIAIENKGSNNSAEFDNNEEHKESANQNNNNNNHSLEEQKESPDGEEQNMPDDNGEEFNEEKTNEINDSE